MLSTLFYFFLALILLVTVHEYGHFQVARWCGVKVLRFSFGFGPVLARWQDKRGTEYAWSLFPLGGYVKMLDETEGEVSAEELPYAFNRQPLWKRVAVVVAGPLFNFLFALVALWLVAVIGIQSLAPMIAEVKPGSLADRAGIRAGQEIVTVNDQPVYSWRDFQFILMPFIGSKADLIFTTKPIGDSQDLQSHALSLADWQLDPKKPDLLASFGLVPFVPAIPPVVGQVVEDSPAAKAGLKVGDVIQAVDGQKIEDWLQVVEYVQTRPNQVISMGLLRNGKPVEMRVRLGSQELNGQAVGLLGVRSQKVDWPAHWLRLQRYSPWEAVGLSIRQTLDLTSTTLTLLGRLASGQLGLHHLSGPVGIAQGAGDSARGGLSYYLAFLALVSISLGVLNLLPIPMLDGGHLLYYLIEKITGKPLAEPTKMVGVYMGLALLMLMMIVALYNDISRLTS